MIAQIIPAKRMPLSLPFLDYLVPESEINNIKVGQLVKIPFRKKEEFGVVFALQNSPTVKENKLKPITEIVFTKPIISKQQLDFLYSISEFYHVHLGFLLKSNLIPLQPRKLKQLQNQNTVQEATFDTQVTQTKPRLGIYQNHQEKIKTIVEHIDPSGQTLLLVPEITAIDSIITALPSNISEKTVIITSEISTKELFSRWLQIWSGEKSVIIGTRSTLLLPWFNLRSIILEDEGNASYKSWDMAPRFHSRDAALFLSKSHGAKLLLLSHTPSVETLFFAQKKVYDSEHTDVPIINRPVQMVDMRAQRRLKNYSLLSHDLLEEFKKITTGDIFFFINRRGTVSYVGCRDCGNVLTCPNCKLALTYHQNTNTLSCHYCHFNQPMPLVCAKCHGTNVNMFGAGTQLAENLIKKIIPPGDQRHIIRIDSDTTNFDKLQKPEDKIIVGTQLAWAHIDWSKVKLFAFLDADSSLFIPEYKIVENLWQQLRDAQFNLPADAHMVAQTNHPEHLVFTSLFDPASFYATQLAERKILGYPPFKFLVKIMNGNVNEKAVQSETEAMVKKLLQLTKNNPEITILGPWETSPYRYNGQYWQVLLAKIAYENYKKNTKLLLSHIPDSWKIDPNPNSILYFS